MSELICSKVSLNKPYNKINFNVSSILQVVSKHYYRHFPYLLSHLLAELLTDEGGMLRKHTPDFVLPFLFVGLCP